MEHQKYARVLRLAAPLAALALAVLRIVTWKAAFDENNLLPVGSSHLLLTVLLCALVFCALSLLSLRLNRLPGTEACFRGGSLCRDLGLAAGGLLLLGNLLVLLDSGADVGTPERIIAAAGAVSGLLLCWLALQTERGPQAFWSRLLPALYAGAALVLRFREWSHDPLVIHILPVLLAWTCCMVEMTLLSAFSLGAGHRRSSVLFGLCAMAFTCMTLTDRVLGPKADPAELLPLLGLALWCAVSAYELLQDGVQSEQPASESEAAAEAEAPETEKNV